MIIFALIFYVAFIGLIGTFFLHIPRTTLVDNTDHFNFANHASITRVHYDAKIELSGDMHVRESLWFTLATPWDHTIPPWRELYMEFSETDEDRALGRLFDRDSFRVYRATYSESTGTWNFVNYALATPAETNSRTVQRFALSPLSNGGFELRIFINEFRGNFNYVIYYTYSNAVTVFEDSAEIHLNLYSGNRINRLSRYQGRFTFPSEMNLSENSFQAFSHFQELESLTINTATNVVEFDILSPRGAITFSDDFDVSGGNIVFRAAMNETNATLFTRDNVQNETNRFENMPYGMSQFDYLASSENFYSAVRSYWQAIDAGRTTRRIIFTIGDVVFAVLVIVLLIFLSRLGYKNFVLRPEEYHIFYNQVPEGLDVMLACELVRARQGLRCDVFAGIIMQLQHQGVIDIVRIDEMQEWKTNNIGIILKNPAVPMSAFTQHCFNILMSAGLSNGRLTFKQLRRFMMRQARNPFGMGLGFCETKNAAKFTSGYFDMPAPFLRQWQRTGNAPWANNFATNNNFNQFNHQFNNQQGQFNGNVQNQTHMSNNPQSVHQTQPVMRANPNATTANPTWENATSFNWEGQFGHRADEMNRRKRTFGGLMLAGGIVLAIAVGLISAALTMTFYGWAFLTPLTIFIGSLYAAQFFLFRENLTQKGENLAERWGGYYRFIKHWTKAGQKNIDDANEWNEMLIYATAFGLSKRITKSMGKRLNLKDRQAMNAHPFMRAGFISMGIRSATRNSFRGTGYNSSGKKSASSGGGSSGGFSSGGGGFGGGGGGGRSGGGRR